MNNPRCDVYVSAQRDNEFNDFPLQTATVAIGEGWGRTFTTHIDQQTGEMANLLLAKKCATEYAMEFNRQFFVVMNGQIVFVATPRTVTAVQVEEKEI